MKKIGWRKELDMETMNKLSLQDLKIGMSVTSSQLSDIYNIHIILTNSSLVDDGKQIKGNIVWFGKELDDTTDKYNEMDAVASIYNTDDTSDGEVFYEE
jgi:hypothetical protein